MYYNYITIVLFSDTFCAMMNKFDDDCDEHPVRDGSINKSEQFGMLVASVIVMQ